MSHVQLVCQRIFNPQTGEFKVSARWVDPTHGVMGGTQILQKDEPRDYPFLGEGEDVRPNKEF